MKVGIKMDSKQILLNSISKCIKQLSNTNALLSVLDSELYEIIDHDDFHQINMNISTEIVNLDKLYNSIKSK